MTPAAALVERTTAGQGRPYLIADPTVLALAASAVKCTHGEAPVTTTGDNATHTDPATARKQGHANDT